MKLALIIGHGPQRDHGAESKDSAINELEWNTDLVSKIFAALTRTEISPVIVHRAIERVQPVKQVNELGPDFCAEFHLNSSDPVASGSEMIYFPSSRRGRELAMLLQNAAVNTLGLPDRGIKGPYKGRGMALLRRTKCPAVIVESFFIDNPKDLRVGTERKPALAVAYAQAFLMFAAVLKKGKETPDR